MNFRILRAVFKKDALSLAPIVALTALFFLADPLIERLQLIPEWSMYSGPIVLMAIVVLIMSVFQLDSPASLTDDWLCRPVGKPELIGAKLLLLLCVVYLPRAIGAFIANIILGHSVAEAFLDAVLLQDRATLFELPIILFSAIVTRTFVQGFGALFAICICVFVLPTPFIRPSGPLSPGISYEMFFSGLQWLSMTPAKVAALLLLAVGFWLMYWRRRMAAARVLMALTVCITVLFLVLPMALVPWNTTFAIQTAAGSAPAADFTRISLRNPRICFPAARRADLSSDTAFVVARQSSGLQSWEDEVLDVIAPDSIAFLTSVEPRGLPPDWRVKLSYVRANYSAGGETIYSLRPAQYITDLGGGGSLAHEWMLPESVVAKAARHTATTYAHVFSDAAEAARVQRPHRWKAAPIAWPRILQRQCLRARQSHRRRLLQCICTSRAHQRRAERDLREPRLRERNGIADFAPSYVRWPYSQHVKFAISSPRLAPHDSITVTAWDTAGHFQKSLVLPGILGADIETCPLPTGNNRFQKANWRDAAPHQVNSISVDEGVQLEVLDFGGTGSPILLLPGLGATAHSYDELGALLAQKHRVIAITRRGSGDSSKPDFGFDTPRLAQDVLEVMDAMKLPKVVLVGHSIAGDELTWLGGHHPDRFNGLVYLDAAYNRAADKKAPAAMRLRELNRLMPPEPPLPPQSLLNYDAATRMLLDRGHVRMPEGELIAARHMNDPYFAGTPTIDGRTQQAMQAATPGA